MQCYVTYDAPTYGIRRGIIKCRWENRSDVFFDIGVIGKTEGFPNKFIFKNYKPALKNAEKQRKERIIQLVNRSNESGGWNLSNMTLCIRKQNKPRYSHYRTLLMVFLAICVVMFLFSVAGDGFIQIDYPERESWRNQLEMIIGGD